MKKALLVTMATLAAAAPVSAADPYDGLKSLMACREAPRPTDTLLSLQRKGSLGGRLEPGLDGESCWPLLPPIEWDGLAFAAICAIVAAPEEVRAHPDLYFEGETYAPFNEVWLVASAPSDQLEGWAVGTLGAGSRFEIDPGLGEGTSALSCSAWHFLLDQPETQAASSR